MGLFLNFSLLGFLCSPLLILYFPESLLGLTSFSFFFIPLSLFLGLLPSFFFLLSSTGSLLSFLLFASFFSSSCCSCILCAFLRQEPLQLQQVPLVLQLQSQRVCP